MSSTSSPPRRPWRSRRSFVAPNTARTSESGLTLLELIVVLVILATLGTVMLTQTTSLTSEARYQQTARTLGQLRDAVAGRQPYSGEDPSGVPAGFVADIGRLPQIGDAGNLAELFDLDEAGSTLPPFGLEPATGDSSLYISCGWRGPYIRLAVGNTALRDGWGRPFTLENMSGDEIDLATSPPATTAIGSITSPGIGTGDSFDVDLDDVVFLDDSVSEDFIRGDVDVRIDPASLALFLSNPSLSGNERILVRLYGPQDGAPVVLAQWPDGGGAPWPDLDDVPDPIEFQDIPAGPRYLRVYVWDDGATPTVPALGDDVAKDVLGSETIAVSDVRRFTVLAGGTSVSPDLQVPHLP